MKKRILEIFGEPISYGGQESFVFNTLKAMDKSNFKIDFLTPYYIDNIEYKKFIEEIGGRLFCLELPFNPGKSRLNIASKIDRILQTSNYDVVHINTGSISVLGICSYLAKKNHVKKILAHSHIANSYNQGILKEIKHETLKFSFTPLFKMTVTDFCAPSFEAAYWQFSRRLFKKKGHIIRNGIDLEEFKYNPQKRYEYRKKLSLTGKLVIGNVGRLSYQKNQEFLIYLLKSILPQIPNCRLLLVGDGPDKSKLMAEIKANHLEEKIILTGNVNNVNDYLQAMDLFLFPSRFEGLGIAGIEAQVSGLPVIVSKFVPKEMKILKTTFFLKMDSLLWTKTILEIDDYLDRYKVLRANSYKNAEKYNIKKTSEELFKLYRS